MKRSLFLVAVAFCVACAGVQSVAATPAAAVAQCRGTDRVVPKQIRFPRGRKSVVVKDTIRLCTSHEHRLNARFGQTMSVRLVAGDKTSFTLWTPTGDTPEGADGAKEWKGELPESGVFTIRVGTDATAKYTLEVTVR